MFLSPCRCISLDRAEISACRRLTVHFSTSDSALTVTHGCALCTRQGKMHTCNPASDFRSRTPTYKKKKHRTTNLLWATATFSRHFTLFDSCHAHRHKAIMSFRNIYIFTQSNLRKGNKLNKMQLIYHLSPPEHCVDCAADQFSVDPCR